MRTHRTYHGRERTSCTCSCASCPTCLRDGKTTLVQWLLITTIFLCSRYTYPTKDRHDQLSSHSSWSNPIDHLLGRSLHDGCCIGQRSTSVSHRQRLRQAR